MSMPLPIDQLALLVMLCATGPNMMFWSAMGLARIAAKGFATLYIRSSPRFHAKDVAIVIPAHNEEQALPDCLAAAAQIVERHQIFIGDDASADRTATVAAAHGCNVFTAPRNMGKARVLDAAIRHFGLCERFGVILILDADSQIDRDYLKHGLSLFDDGRVAVVAGHAVSRAPHRIFTMQLVIHAYRTRLYAMVQALFKFGQAWGPVNVTFVAPGFASMYRADALAKIDIAAPGLVIEDINMTFEVHRQKLGRVAYSPLVKCSTEDPATLRDYGRQVRRWSLGLWQTALKQGMWPGKFWPAFLLAQLETVCAALVVALMPFAVAWALYAGHALPLWSPLDGGLHDVTPLWLPVLFVAAEMAFAAIVAIVLRKPSLILCAPFFPLLRFIDSFWTLATIIGAFTTKSDGRWQSPVRKAQGASA
jgi:poly-beta-1,6-N-acetyl-D-glucosamine synthase